MIFYHKRIPSVFITISVMFFAAFSVYFTLVVLHNVFLTFIIYYFVCCIGIPIIDVVIMQRRKFYELLHFIGFKEDKRSKSILFGVLHGIAIYSLMLLAYFILKDKVELSNVIKNVQQWGMPLSGKWVIFLILVIFNGLVEEIFWRGYCFSRLRQVIKGWQTILIVTCFYVSYHFVTLISFFNISILSVSLIVIVCFAGIIWALMRNYFDNLWASAIGHVLSTCGYMTIFMLL